ncbi:uncharacterized protein TRAVEDRAFT_64729 [Trametes versicolor FP-101664 SS1]|uniref:uncharacterized protein n=1 Tax=Trametes versicolor (strain FP-101664) TaxID=717944 RepID=UPI0004621EF9|nr:uncharacterized protein TRAVEDRAFT_64729 [Trametes versicolor FP-101664 SS1]EIW58109.1 hypothetical protein TRAVEDRAFT_64729 [Trametes versicolor FP-101664 SS1]
MPHKRAKRSVREKTRAESGADLVPGVRKSIENEEIPKGAARVLNAAKIQQEFAEKKRKQRDEADGAGPSRKKQKGGAGGQNEGANALRIKPGESIGHFNRRVEDSLRHTVKEAMQSSSAKMRRTQKEEQEELAQKKAEKKAAVASSKAAKSTKTSDGSDDDDEPPSKLKSKPKPEDKSERAVPLRRPETKHDGKAKEFERVSSSAPKRLNDIVQAPPQIKQLPRKAKKLAAAGGTPKTGVSLKDGVLSMAQKAMMEEERDRVIRLYREMKRRKGST